MNILMPITGLAITLLVACNVSPEFLKPKVSHPGAFSQNDLYDGASVKHWAGVYKDSKLASLVNQARSNNHNLKALYQRTLQSRAITKREGASRLPQVGGDASYSRFDNSDDVDTRARNSGSLYRGALTVGWELDLFGRVANLVKSAEADTKAADAAYEDLLLITETEVALNYFRLRALEGEIQAVQRSVGTRREALDIVKKRFKGGAVSDLDVAQSETLYATSQAELARLKRSRDIRVHAIAVLTGQPASNFSLKVKPLYGSPTKVPAGLPSELLLRRPDIRQAEYQLRSAHAKIAVAKANFYPRITLGATAGTGTYHAGNVFKGSANFYDLGPSVKIPIFQGGRLRADLNRSESAYVEAVEVYKQSVIEAFAEVENALKSWRHLASQRAASQRAVSSAKRAQKISDEQYRSGIVDFIASLDSERVLLDSERALYQVIGEEYENSVLLIRSIGGNWK